MNAESGTLPARGLVVAAPSSGAGKTTVTLGILRALSRRGLEVTGAKSGPDHIDPKFHRAACGRECVNLDSFAMSPDRLTSLLPASGLLVIEGAMGLFDGSAGGRGATSELAGILGLPVVLVVDCARMGQSVAALVAGYASHDPAVKIGGVILNNLGSRRHEMMLKETLQPGGIPVLGAVHRQQEIARPSRHLGLVQADEQSDLETFLDMAGEIIAASLDLEALAELAQPLPSAPRAERRVDPPAQRIAVARDAAFGFAYPHLLDDWRSGGAEIFFFSPLADEEPEEAGFIYLPGGYPELHAGQLAGAERFLGGLRRAVETGVMVYGECGGFMVLGDALIDAHGASHQMIGALRLVTSFEQRSLHLGYRSLRAPSGPFKGEWYAHEFHYSTTISAKGNALFDAKDAWDVDLGTMGLIENNVLGSFAHLIDRV